jgi:hypothetical protein
MRNNSLKLCWGLPFTLLLGCPAPDEGGTEGSSDSSSGSSSGAQTSTVSNTTIMMTTSDSMSGSATAATTVETTSPDSSDTTDVTTGGTTDATASTSESGSGPGSSSGGNPDGAYGECDFSDPMNPTCPVAGEDCNQLMGDGGSWCSIPCQADDDCPDPASGEATRHCSMTFGHCSLDCSDGMGGMVTCPDGMDCVLSGPATRCVWPPA